MIMLYGRARWPCGQCARRAIAEAKQRSVIRWVTKIYFLLLLRAWGVTLSRWSRLHWQSHSSFKEG
jgi:hypothetical protein